MRRVTCPYLGLKDDPTTTLNFPSPGNFCHQARPLASIKGTYQEKYCLTANHTACPLYQARHPMPLPASIPTRSPSFNRRQLLALLGVPAMVVAVAFFTYMVNNFNVQNWMKNPIPDTGPGIVDNNFGLLGAGPPVERATSTASSTNPTPLATINNCPLPENWVTYTVKPTDSLFRLSVIYGVSVEDMQRVNCLGDQTVILPGRVLYVPFIPTNTPIDTQSQPPQALPTKTPPPNLGLPNPTNTKTSESLPEATAQPTSTAQPTLPVQPTTTIPPLVTPTVPAPTNQPTSLPTIDPSPLPTIAPTQLPTIEPSPLPTLGPTAQPTQELPPSPTSVIPPEPTLEPTLLPPTEQIPLPTSEPPQITQSPLPPTEAPTPAPTSEPAIDPLITPASSGTLISSSADLIDLMLFQINRIP